MKGVRKPFSQSLYDQCDERAKSTVEEHLTSKGYTVVVPPENYGADIYCVQGPLRLYHEVEVSLTWERGSYPFINSSVPERKIRLVNKYDAPLYFWQLSNDLVGAVVTPGHQLKDIYLVEVPNRLVATGEYFYRVPMKYCKQIVFPVEEGMSDIEWYDDLEFEED